MANANPTKSRTQTHRDRLRWLAYAKHEFNLHGERRSYVCIEVADALGLPEPTNKAEGYEVLRRFYECDPKHRAESNAAYKVTKAQKRAARAKWVDANSDGFLMSYQWRQLRMQVIKERGARCECCGASPKDGIVINVDHIKPRRKYPELALVKANLQVLCEVCNHGKGSWDETDWRADSQMSGESSTDSPVTRSGDGDGQMARTFPRLVKAKQARNAG